jgi:hypothetical protein
MTAMDTKTLKPEMPEETPEERERLLSRYSARDRWLIEDALKSTSDADGSRGDRGGIKEQESESWALSRIV